VRHCCNWHCVFLVGHRRRCRCHFLVPLKHVGHVTGTVAGNCSSLLTILALSVCLSASICLSVYLSDCLSVCLSVCLSICRSVCLSICLIVYLSICLSVYLSDCLSDCLRCASVPLDRVLSVEEGEFVGLLAVKGTLGLAAQSSNGGGRAYTISRHANAGDALNTGVSVKFTRDTKVRVLS
jgi:hypothetical protein